MVACNFDAPNLSLHVQTLESGNPTCIFELHMSASTHYYQDIILPDRMELTFQSIYELWPTQDLEGHQLPTPSLKNLSMGTVLYPGCIIDQCSAELQILWLM